MRKIAIVALLGLLLTPTLGTAQEFSDLQSNGTLHLRGYGSFFIQGDIVQGNAAAGAVGDMMVNQMYVQYMLPQQRWFLQSGKLRKHSPIVFVHGGILSSKSWQTTPDGRMGWDEYFVRQRFDTYLAEQVSRARSGFDARKFNMVRSGALPPTEQPPIFIATDQILWNGFRWGATPCTASPCYATTTPRPGLQFPMHTVGVGSGANLQMLAQAIPDLNGTLPAATPPLGPLPTDPAAPFVTPAQMAKLATKLGGAVLVGHSESSWFPTMAAFQPDSGCYPYTTAEACKVKGIIQLEVGCFGNLTPDHVNTLKHIPILVVVGDFFPPALVANFCATQINQITAAGGDIKFAVLPQLTPGSIYPGSPGPIFGNEHMFMLGTNNLEIADILIGWLTSRGL